MTDFYIFDIPVYLRPQSRYYVDMEKATNRHLKRLFPSVESLRERFPRQCESLEQKFHEAFGGPWDFNQVVGWLRLYVEGSHIGGHLWWAGAKRLQTRMLRTFYLVTTSNILPTSFTRNDDSGKIFTETLAEIEALSKKKRYKGRYFDLTLFRNLRPFVDWRGWMRWRTSLKNLSPANRTARLASRTSGAESTSTGARMEALASRIQSTRSSSTPRTLDH